ncbi:MAG: NADP-dependent oxidoreductase [Thermoanaerobaculia bacterium]
MNSLAPINRQITLASRPVGYPSLSDFRLVYAPLSSPAAGEVLVRSIYLSLDPYIRVQMNQNGSDGGSVRLGEVMPGGAAAFVVESGDPAFRAGDAVEGMLGWQEYAIVPAHALRKLEPGLSPISLALGALGLPGLTAYFGLLEICRPQRGETVVVSGAAGAVGMLAGQIARINGCRVVGLANADAELTWLRDELGFDAVSNYGSDPDFDARLAELCPEGIDVYFDNVGGALSDAVMRRINVKARISVCGQISEYNLEAPETGPRWLGHLLARTAKVEGFLVSDFADRFSEGRKQLDTWLKQGKLRYREAVAQGIEAAPQAFIGMLHGTNQGKQLVQLGDF